MNKLLKYLLMAFWDSVKTIIRASQNNVPIGAEDSNTRGECAHIDHTRNENYQNPENGILVTAEVHLQMHLEASQANYELFLQTGDKTYCGKYMYHAKSAELIQLRVKR